MGSAVETESRARNTIRDLFKGSKRESAVDIVVSSIRNLLIQRKLKSGDKLPTELELADSIGVSRTAVREAMKILSAFGVVEVVQGDGTYIARQVSRKIFDPLIFNIILDISNLSDLVELRRVIEYDVIRLIMQHNDPSVFKSIREIMKAAESDYDQTNDAVSNAADWDIAFHEELGNATQNKFLAKIYGFLIDIFIRSVEDLFVHEVGGSAALDYHTVMVDAMEAGDKEKAFAIVDDTIETWQKLVYKYQEKI